jgi:hypothetical protein
MGISSHWSNGHDRELVLSTFLLAVEQHPQEMNQKMIKNRALTRVLATAKRKHMVSPSSIG